MLIINPYRFGGGAADSLLTDLVAWWSMDETSGTRVNVHNPGTHDLTDYNTVGSATGIVGNAAVFDAANNEHLGTTGHDDLRFTTGDWVMTGWGRIDTGTSNSSLLAGCTDGTNQPWLLSLSTTGPYLLWRVRNAGNTTFVSAGNVSISYDTMFFFEVGFIAATETIFCAINRGTRSTNTLTGGGGASTPSAFGIGGRAGALYISGRADNFTIHKGRQLTSDELDRLYSSGSGLAYPG